MEGLIVQYAPVILVILFVIFSYKITVSPTDLEKKHREILNDIGSRFVTWAVFNTLKDSVTEVKQQTDKIYNILLEMKNGDKED